MSKQKQPTKPSPEQPATKLQTPDQRLKALLAGHPGLRAKLIEAIETDRFFITVTFQKKYKPTDQHDLHHYFCRRQFMVNDVLPSMKHIANDFKAKEMPGAEIQSDAWI